MRLWAYLLFGLVAVFLFSEFDVTATLAVAAFAVGTLTTSAMVEFSKLSQSLQCLPANYCFLSLHVLRDFPDLPGCRLGALSVSPADFEGPSDNEVQHHIAPALH